MQALAAFAAKFFVRSNGMKRCDIGGQAVMEGVMMRSPDGTALAVRQANGSIVTEYDKAPPARKKGTFPTWPVVRGVYAFIDSLTTGMKVTTRSAELIGGEPEEPTKFEKWMAEKLGKSAMDVATGIAVVLGVLLAVGLFIALPTFLARLFHLPAVWESLVQGGFRLAIFVGYLFAVSAIKDVRRVFMYHGAEHKTIACYEHDAPLTPDNAMQYSRLHARCGTNYLFLVMAVSILFFAFVTAILQLWWENIPYIAALGIRILFIPVVAGLAYELLKAAAKSDNFLCRIVRAPGLLLQRITTREPSRDMLEVAITAFNVCMDPSAAGSVAADKARDDGGFAEAFSDGGEQTGVPDGQDGGDDLAQSSNDKEPDQDA